MKYCNFWIKYAAKPHIRQNATFSILFNCNNSKYFNISNFVEFAIIPKFAWFQALINSLFQENIVFSQNFFIYFPIIWNERLWNAWASQMEYIATPILRRLDALHIFLNFFKNSLFFKFFDGPRSGPRRRRGQKIWQNSGFLKKGEKYARHQACGGLGSRYIPFG